MNGEAPEGAGIVELVTRLRRLDVTVQADGERLRINAPKGALTPELRDELGRRKDELLGFLRSAAFGEAGAPTVAPPLRALPRDVHPPLSFAQQRLWLLDRLEPGNPAYNMPSAVRLTGRLDAAALERSLSEIVQRHEVLRTNFATENDRPVQVVSPARSFELSRRDLRELSVEQREGELQRVIQEEAVQPFDLAQGPLLRGRLLLLEADECVLLLTFHHIVSDGWSAGVFVRELAALYNAFAAGRPSPLAPLPVQYADYARWQREWLQGDVLERQLAYWREQLGGDAPLLELPLDRPRPPVQTARGGRESFAFPRALTAALNDLSQREGATLFMTLLAGFNALLYRDTGQEDLVVGTPIANRNRGEIEGLIGFFLNSLALRTDLSGNPCFRELLARVREVTLGAYAHQDVPFEKLLEELHPARQLSHSPLFQVLLVLQNAPLEPLELTGLTLAPLEGDSGAAKFDLNLHLVETADGLKGEAFYNADLFDAATIRRFCEHYRNLLEAAAAEPDRPLTQLPVLTPEERARHGAARNRVAPANDFEEFPRAEIERSIGARFELQAQRHAARLAVKTDRHEWTYAELNRAANRLAHALLAADGAESGQVALLFEQDAPMLAGVLGVLKAGKAYVPLDPNYPRERLEYMLEDSQAGAILTNAQNRALAEELGGGERTIINADALPPDAPAENPDVAVAPDQLAYILYTSGSTGRPKGVMQNHRNVLHFARVYTNALHLAPADRLSLLASYSFDAAVMDLFGALLNGASLHPKNIHDEGLDELAAWLIAREITVYHSTPTVYRYFAGALPDDGAFARRSKLRLVVLGGEAADRRDVEYFQKQFPEDCLFVNGLGPTESTIALQQFFDGASALERAAAPVGFPVADTEVVLLDPDGRPTELFGEIGIRSRYVALGYWRQPEVTRAAFGEPDAATGARLYRTGDLARQLPDGSLEYLGRRDSQVKVRGHRIEVGEIEALLGEHPAVAAAAVAVQDREGGDRQLVAYFVPAAAPPPAGGDLRDVLRQRLPDYMLPAAFVALEAMPLTPTGKIDRRRLPPIDWPEHAAAEDDVAPRTPSEELIAGIWATLLNLERVGARQNFFALGGHSLLATQVLSRVRDAFGLELPLRAIFEAPTVAALARRVDDAGREREGEAPPPIARIDREGDLPLSFSQERMWFLHQLMPRGNAYNMTTALRLQGPLDAAALERAFDALARRHESLRTTFGDVEGRPVQRIAPAPNHRFELEDLGDGPSDGQRGEALRRAGEENRQPFDLARGPLLRVFVYRLGDEEHLLLLSMHHIISDMWSLGVMARELAVLYGAETGGAAAELPALDLQYADYAHWQREWLAGAELERQLAYWRPRLEGAPILELPGDRPRPAVREFRGASASLDFPPALVQTIQATAAREGVTPFMLLLAAFKVLLWRHARQDDVVVGAPVANRTRSEIEGTIGAFINTLALRTDLSGDPSFRELLGRVRETTLGAYAHQELPFEKLVEELHPERDMSHTPLVQVLFNFRNAPFDGRLMETMIWTPEEVARGAVQFDLTVLADLETTPGLYAEYDVELFDAGTIERLLGHYRRLLEAAAAAPERRISQLPLMDDAERRRVLIEWNDTARGVPPGCLPQWFAEQAERTPRAVAVAAEDGEFTYAALAKRTAEIAALLRANGAGPGTIVGLCLERSREMVAALLGVLQAGAAYLPLDPAFPRERLSFMLEDSGAALLLTAGAAAEGLRAPDVLNLDEATFADNPQSPSDAQRRPNPQSQDLAYVIYTSGSTGKPKGVAVTHGALANFLSAMRERPGLRADEALLAVTTLSFDIAALELFLPLIVGGRIELADRETAADGRLLLARLAESRAAVLQATPATWRLLLEAGWASSPGLRAWCGGEALPRELAAALLERVDPAGSGGEVWNLYGPTETTIWSSVERIDDPAAPIAIGRPLANTRFYILDSNRRPTPVGVAGELCIGGAGLAREYLNRPELTAERFIDWRADESAALERLYRTGDLARWLPDGRVKCLGRLDHQVKVRGFRIELGEIETVLTAHPGIDRAVVVAREDGPSVGDLGDVRLVAYIVSVNDPAPTLSELRPHLREFLPDYMIPSAVVALERLPLTPNGKIDRRALPAPERKMGGEEYIAPRTPVEETLVEIWREILDLERVSVQDNFFDLGGHSLLATQLVSRLRQSAFPVELPLRQLFETPTVAGLAAAVTQLLVAQQDADEMSTLIGDIQNMSPEELAKLLEAD